MNLYIAEKPSQGRDLARNLGCTKHADGALTDGRDNMVTWCMGHLLELAMPDDYSPDLKRWTSEALPFIPENYKYLVKKETAAQFRTVTGLIRKAGTVFIATDFDREGEAIARNLLRRAGFRGNIKRVCLRALDDKSIQKALRTIVDGSETVNLWHAALARSRADWLVGINLTRLYTVLAGRFGVKSVLNIGRVTTPTVELVVKRDEEIENFVPVPYFTLRETADAGSGSFGTLWKVPEEIADESGRCLKREYAEKAAAETDGRNGTVTEYSAEDKKTPQPLPFDLNSLQQYAARTFGFSSKKTLDIAESLYDRHHLTSYPRTDSRYIPVSQFADAPEILRSLSAMSDDLRAMAEKADPALKSRAWNTSKVTAHHAIIPTGEKKDLAALSSDERKIFHAVARAYIAQFYEPAVYRQSKAVIDCMGHIFTASSKTLRKDGWTALYPKRKGPGKSPEDKSEETEAAKESEDTVADLPPLEKGGQVLMHDPVISDRMTEPPAHFTEATLLYAMEHIAKYVSEESFRKILNETSGLGTPATRAEIIDGAVRKDFLVREGKSLLSTPKARDLMHLLPLQIKSPGFTAIWETELEKIAGGGASDEAFLERVGAWIRHVCEVEKSGVLNPGSRIYKALSSFSKETGGTASPGTKRRKSSGTGRTRRRKTAAEDGTGTDAGEVRRSPARRRRTSAAPGRKTVKAEEGAPLCPKCGKPMVRRKSAKGEFWGCQDYPSCRGTRNIGSS